MGQTVSRRHDQPPQQDSFPSSTVTTSVNATASPTPEVISQDRSDSTPPDQSSHRRSTIRRRLFSSFSKPSLRTRFNRSRLAPSVPDSVSRADTLPTPVANAAPRARKRRWRLSRKHRRGSEIGGSESADGDGSMNANRARRDREVDEFGALRNADDSTGGEERDVTQNNVDSSAMPSSSHARASNESESAPTSAANNDQDGGDEVVIAPTEQPPLPSSQSHESPPSVPPVQNSSTAPQPQPPTSQQPSQGPQAVPNNPRHFPSPGTLVVVQGVVHTTDVERVPDGTSTSSANNSSAAPNNNSTVNTNAPTSRATGNMGRVGGSGASRASSVPPDTRSTSSPGSRTRNRLSSMLSRPRPRPISMLPAVPSSPSNVQEHESGVARDVTGDREDSDHSAVQEERPNEVNDGDDRDGHVHGVSMAQGPIGGGGLSASSIDVLGTLLSVAAAATAASLLTGSSEPIFSSGLAPPHPPHQPHPPPSPASTGIANSNVPTERPLSPTPTSDAGRMRHVWSSLRDRLGLGGNNHSGSPLSRGSEGIAQPGNVTGTPSLMGGNAGQGLTGPGRVPRDAREVMLAEMARAFNLGLGLGSGQSPASSPSSASPPSTALGSNQTQGERGDTNGTQFAVPIPPPDSFERFLMDLQTDLRVALTQEHDLGTEGRRERGQRDLTASDMDGEDQAENVGDDEVDDHDAGEENESMPDLRSLSDSDSSGSEMPSHSCDEGHSDEEEAEETADAKDDKYADGNVDVDTAHERSSGHTSVSAPDTADHPSAHTFLEDHQPAQASTSAQELSATNALNHDPTIARGLDTDYDYDRLLQEPQDLHADAAQETRGAIAVATGLRLPSDEEFAVQTATRTREEARDQYTEAVVGVRQNECESPDAAVPTASSQGSSNAGSESAPGLSSFVDPIPPTSRNITIPTAPVSETASTTPVSTSAPVGTTSSTIDSTSNPGTTEMPFHLPNFRPGSASRTEHTAGGGINWWRMYRFPAITSPVQDGQQGQGQSRSQSPANSSWSSPQNYGQNGNATPRGDVQEATSVQEASSSSLTPNATATEMPEASSASDPRISTSPLPPQNGRSNEDEHQPGRNTESATTEGPRPNIVVPVIVVGLQSVNMDRQPPHPHPLPEHDRPHPMDDGGEGVGFNEFGHPMPIPPPLPMHLPEPPELPDVPNQQPRGRTWSSRAVNAIRNLRPTRRHGTSANPPSAETPGSRTFLIYVIGGYYPPDHQIITGGNLDSFEALWELAELLGQVKPPTVTREEIEKSGLEVIKGSSLDEYEKNGRVASNCVDRCLICLDDYTPEEDLRVLSCRHAFHRGCVDRWLETGRNNCPACRSKGVGNESNTSEPITGSTSTPLAGPAVT